MKYLKNCMRIGSLTLTVGLSFHPLHSVAWKNIQNLEWLSSVKGKYLQYSGVVASQHTDLI